MCHARRRNFFEISRDTSKDAADSTSSCRETVTGSIPEINGHETGEAGKIKQVESELCVDFTPALMLPVLYAEFARGQPKRGGRLSCCPGCRLSMNRRSRVVAARCSHEQVAYFFITDLRKIVVPQTDRIERLRRTGTYDLIDFCA